MVRMIAPILALAYAAWHLLTLTQTPLPWYDEVFFAGIAQNVAKGNGFYTLPTLQHAAYPALFYGPLYFWLQAAVIKAIGLQLFSFRLLPLAAGLGCLALMCYYTRGYNGWRRWLPLGLLALAPLFISSMHNGRMETLAAFFLLLAFSPVLLQQALTPGRAVWAGCFMALALLTTPRAAVLMPGFGVYYLLQGPLNRHTLGWLAGVALVPLAVWGSWSFFETGHPLGALRTVQSHSVQATSFIGPTLLRAWPNDVLLWLFILPGGVLGWQQRNPLLLALLTSCLCYTLLVVENAPYLTLALPFAALGTGLVAQLAPARAGRWLRPAAAGVLVLFAGTFIAKNVLLAATWPMRNARALRPWLAAHLPKGAHVLAEPTYFFELQRAGYNTTLFLPTALAPHQIPGYLQKKTMDAVLTDRSQQPLLPWLSQAGYTHTHTLALPLQAAIPRLLGLPRQPQALPGYYHALLLQKQ